MDLTITHWLKQQQYPSIFGSELYLSNICYISDVGRLSFVELTKLFDRLKHDNIYQKVRFERDITSLHMIYRYYSYYQSSKYQTPKATKKIISNIKNIEDDDAKEEYKYDHESQYKTPRKKQLNKSISLSTSKLKSKSKSKSKSKLKSNEINEQTKDVKVSDIENIVKEIIAESKKKSKSKSQSSQSQLLLCSESSLSASESSTNSTVKAENEPKPKTEKIEDIATEIKKPQKLETQTLSQSSSVTLTKSPQQNINKTVRIKLNENPNLNATKKPSLRLVVDNINDCHSNQNQKKLIRYVYLFYVV